MSDGFDHRPSEHAGAEFIVDGQWYAPKWGCDSLQYAIDAIRENDPLRMHIDLRKKLLELLGEWRDRLSSVSGAGPKMELEAAIGDLQDLIDRVP